MKKHSQIVSIVLIVGLLIVVNYLVTIQIEKYNQLTLPSAANEQIGTLPTQIIIGESVKRIRRIVPSIEIDFSRTNGLIEKYFIKWQNDYMCHRKSYLQQRLLMLYMHEEDGKKQAP